MAKPLKIFLIAAALLLTLIVGGVLAAAALFDPNDYRDQIAEAAKKQTGRALELGELELKIFPWLAVGAENVKLGNAEGFGKEPFAEIGAAHVGVKLLPLLMDRQLEISTLTVSGLRLRLAVDKDGKNNWSDLAEPKEEAEPEPEAPKEEPAVKLDKLAIGGLVIEDGALSYSDGVAGKSYTLENLNLKTGSIELGEPVELEMSVSAAASAPAVKADVAFSGTVDADLENKKYLVQDLLLKIEGSGQKMLQGEDAKFATELGGALSAEPGKQVAFSGLKLNFSGGNSQLEASGDYSGDFNLDLAKQLLTLPALQLSLSASGKAIPGGKQDVKLNGGLSYDLAQGALQFDKAQLAAAGLNISTSIKGSGLKGETPQLSGPISIASFNPRELMQKLALPPVQTTDPAVLKEASLSANFKGTFKSATLSDVVLKLDQTTARGRIDVRDFGTQAIQFALNLDQFDADRYMAPAAKDAAATKTEGKKGSINDTVLPAEALNGLNAEGTLDIATLKVKGLKIANAQVKLAGGKGEVKKQQISAKLYGGTVALNHEFKPGKQPGYALKTSLSALDANPFLKDFIGKDWVSGLGSLTMDLSGNGQTVGDLRRALNGDLGVKVENGAVKGFNLGQIIRKGQSLLAGQAAPAETEPQKTDFTAMSFTAKIINGMLKSDALDASSPLFRMAGSGEIDLVNETINYLAKPTIVESSKGEGGKGLEDLKGLMIPIKLTGSLFSPSYKLDLETALKQKAMDKVNEKVDVKKDELKQKLNDKLNKWLMPKPKAAPPAEAPAPAPAADPAPPPS